MIGIVTVFYSENYGSVLQAFALRKYITKLGHEAVYLNTRNNHSSHSLKNTIMSVGFKLLHLDIGNALLKIKKYKNFERTLKNFSYIDYSKENDNFELIIIGSDTVWDVDAKYFLASQPLFWLRSMSDTPVISYAASVANSSKERLVRLKYPKECLNNLSGISVRDKYSFDVISSIASKKVHLVCDPTLLLKMSDYDDLVVNVSENKYAAVYLFEDINDDLIRQIKEWSYNTGIKLISICKKLKWCDTVIEPSVENFISYIKNAEYVITNTFHGTIFSIIFEKQFISLGKKKKKISEFLSMLKLTNRIYDGSKAQVIQIEDKIDYNVIGKRLEDIRKQSYEYLNQYLQ